MFNAVIWDEYEPVIDEAWEWIRRWESDLPNVDDVGEFLIGHADRVAAACSVWWGEAIARFEGKESSIDGRSFYFWTTALAQFGDAHGIKVEAVWNFLWETSTTNNDVLDVLDPINIRRNDTARPDVALYSRAELELERLDRFAKEEFRNKEGTGAKLDHDNGEREVKAGPSSQDRESNERPQWDSENR